MTAVLQERKTEIVTATKAFLQLSQECIVLRAADEECVLKAVNSGLENRHVVGNQGEPGHEFLPPQIFAVFNKELAGLFVLFFWQQESRIKL